jgi:hypothetical protein
VVEQGTHKPLVSGPTPLVGTCKRLEKRRFFFAHFDQETFSPSSYLEELPLTANVAHVSFSILL